MKVARVSYSFIDRYCTVPMTEARKKHGWINDAMVILEKAAFAKAAFSCLVLLEKDNRIDMLWVSHLQTDPFSSATLSAIQTAMNVMVCLLGEEDIGGNVILDCLSTDNSACVINLHNVKGVIVKALTQGKRWWTNIDVEIFVDGSMNRHYVDDERIHSIGYKTFGVDYRKRHIFNQMVYTELMYRPKT